MIILPRRLPSDGSGYGREWEKERYTRRGITIRWLDDTKWTSTNDRTAADWEKEIIQEL